MRALITGGAGFVGSHLADALIARGDEVVCLDNLVNGSLRNIEHLREHERFRFVQADVQTWATPSALSDIEVVFHNAASKSRACLADPELDLRVNGLGTLRLARAAAQAGVRKFVHASTGSVVGSTSDEITEGSPTRPLLYYGVSKLAGEQYVRVVGELTGLDWTVLRYFHVIGPRQDPGAVATAFVRAALKGGPLTIHGTGAQVRSFTSVYDVVKANLSALRSAWSGRTLNCASGLRVPVIELADCVRSEIGPVPVVHEAFRDGEVMDFRIDNSAIRSLGMRFNTDWQWMVRDVIACESGSVQPIPQDRAIA